MLRNYNFITMKILSYLSFAVIVLLSSCKKDTKDPDPEPEPETPTGAMKIEFENVMDTVDLEFDTKYVNLNGDTFTVSKFNYYISNIVITKNDNSTWAEPNSYHLVQVSEPASSLVTLSKVPLGSYKSISFMLGVDSTRNCSGAQTGDLAQSKNMFWAWSTGYIMLKLEGSSPKSGAPDKSITLHMGGYYGENKAQRDFKLDFTGGATAEVTGSATPLVHLSVDASKIMNGQNVISLNTDYFVMSAGPKVKKFAVNYAKMISFEHVHNN